MVMATTYNSQANPGLQSRGPQNIGSGDRLSLTIFFALVLHSLIILGISFDIHKNPQQKLPGLEVILVQSKTDKKIKDADYLAQASQEGSGESQEKMKPTTPLVPRDPTGKEGETREVVPETRLPSNPEPQRQEILTAKSSTEKIAAGQSTPETQQKKSLTSLELLSRSKEIASLTAEIDQTQRTFAQQPKRKFISARTKEYRYASYEEAWRAKVERIGKINFPDEAKRQKLSGKLVMAVTINAEGKVTDIEIRKTSKHKILDDAAIRIVTLASPFSPFPEEIRKDTDELVIVRTWVFEAGSRFSAQ